MVQFLSGCDAARPSIGAVVVVSPEPLYGVVLHLLDGCKHVLIQPLVADSSVVALNVGILLRLARLNGLDSGQVGCSEPWGAQIQLLRSYPIHELLLPFDVDIVTIRLPLFSYPNGMRAIVNT